MYELKDAIEVSREETVEGNVVMIHFIYRLPSGEESFLMYCCRKDEPRPATLKEAIQGLEEAKPMVPGGYA